MAICASILVFPASLCLSYFFLFIPLLTILGHDIPARVTARDTASDIALLHPTILNFDSLNTTLSLITPPTPYHNLHFTSFSAFDPFSPSLQHLISPRDHNCAKSPPNALLGSQSAYDPFDDPSQSAVPGRSASYMGPWPASFRIANHTAMLDKGLKPHFELMSFYIKPLDFPDASVTVYVRGYSVIDPEPRMWEAEFPIGYHRPFHVQMRNMSGKAWALLWKVEVWAEFGEGKADWEFCVDDLVVGFEEVGKTAEMVDRDKFERKVEL